MMCHDCPNGEMIPNDERDFPLMKCLDCGHTQQDLDITYEKYMEYFKPNTPEASKARAEKAFLASIPKRMIEKYSIQFDKEGELAINIPAYINIQNPVLTNNTNVIIEISNDIISVTLWKEVYSMHTTVSEDKIILSRLKAKELPEGI